MPTDSEETGVVDVVMIDEESQQCLLGLVDLEPWGQGYERTRSLEARLKEYVAYWDSGQLLADFPAARYVAVKVTVFFKEAPDAEGEVFLERTGEAIRTLGIGFGWEMLEG